MAQWTKQQRQLYVRARAALERWETHGYQVLWVTLTSAPESPKVSLFKQHDKLRKRIIRQFGFDYERVVVETSEGHGVLHMFWAWRDPDQTRAASFYLPHEWLRQQWKELHGATHINVKRYRAGPDDRLKLSRYIVQYAAGQEKLVRWSASQLRVNGMSLGALKKAIYREIASCWYSMGGVVAMPWHDSQEQASFFARMDYSRSKFFEFVGCGSGWIGEKLFAVVNGELVAV